MELNDTCNQLLNKIEKLDHYWIDEYVEVDENDVECEKTIIYDLNWFKEDLKKECSYFDSYGSSKGIRLWIAFTSNCIENKYNFKIVKK